MFPSHPSVPASSFVKRPARAQRETIVVLGIGNVLWADEGFGVRCVEALQQRWDCVTPAGQEGPDVQLIDGGTQGLYLLPHVQAADRLLILDAVDYGLPPGTLKLVENDEVPSFLGARKMSLHQTGFQEVLALADLTGRYPREVLLIGCQPEELEDYGGSLRDCVKLALEDALVHAVAALRRWGVSVRPRGDEGVDRDAAVTADLLALARYEGQRPAAEVACRIGDARFLSPAAEPQPA